MTLVPVDPRSAASITSLLERAAEWLNAAVERSDAAEVAVIKAQIMTAANATKNLDLSKEIQSDAQEMVRRAEYALGKAIRKGQAEGTIAGQGYKGVQAAPYQRVRHGRVETVQPRVPEKNSRLPSPHDFISNGSEIHEIYTIADMEPEMFDAVLSEAKAEGNLSRANVVRKVKGQPAPATRDTRADMIESLAAQGYSSRQMPAKVGVSEETCREIARTYAIEIPADRSVGGTRRHDSTRIASETVIALEGLVMGVELIDYDAIDPAQASQWADSLKHSLEALNRFRNQIRKATQ